MNTPISDRLKDALSKDEESILIVSTVKLVIDKLNKLLIRNLQLSLRSFVHVEVRKNVRNESVITSICINLI